MAEVARIAGVSKQTVYSHFRSKDELFRACVSTKIALYQLDSEYDGDESLEAALLDYGRKFLELMNDPAVILMYRLMISHCIEFPKLIKNFHSTGPVTLENAVARTLQRIEPDLFKDNAHEAATDFMYTLREPYFSKVILNLRGPMDAREKERQLQRTVAAFLHSHRPGD